MKAWTVCKIDCEPGERETVIALVGVTGSIKLQSFPEGELNHQLATAFKDGLAEQARREEAGNTPKHGRHPFAPYFANGKLYPRYELSTG